MKLYINLAFDYLGFEFNEVIHKLGILLRQPNESIMILKGVSLILSSFSNRILSLVLNMC